MGLHERRIGSASEQKETTSELTSVREIFEGFKKLNVTVIGDAALNAYFETGDAGTSQRYDVAGEAAFTAAAVRALGAKVDFISVVGNDLYGGSVLTLIRNADISTEHVIVADERVTVRKERYYHHDDQTHIDRKDFGDKSDIDHEAEEQVVKLLEKAFEHSDLILISDYKCGVITDRIISEIARLQEKYPDRKVVADSRQIERFRHLRLAAIKPNYGEVSNAIVVPTITESITRVDKIKKSKENLLEYFQSDIVAITVDREGAVILQRSHRPYQTFAKPVSISKQTIGAGDTFISTFALALTLGVDPEIAAELGQAASSVVVSKRRTLNANAREVVERVSSERKFLKDIEAIRKRVGHFKPSQRVVFAEGTFDLFDENQFHFLNWAREQGNVLIIGLDETDQPEKDLNRKIELLSLISSVDGIVLVNPKNRSELLNEIKADVLASQGKKNPEDIFIDAWGGVNKSFAEENQNHFMNYINAVSKVSQELIGSDYVIRPPEIEHGERISPIDEIAAKSIRQTLLYAQQRLIAESRSLEEQGFLQKQDHEITTEEKKLIKRRTPDYFFSTIIYTSRIQEKIAKGIVSVMGLLNQNKDEKLPRNLRSQVIEATEVFNLLEVEERRTVNSKDLRDIIFEWSRKQTVTEIIESFESASEDEKNRFRDRGLNEQIIAFLKLGIR